MQVPQVTEKVALAVVELYPTLFSLARAYSMLVSPLFLLTRVLIYKLPNISRTLHNCRPVFYYS
jgi:crossover junction endonuclease MUS81